MRSVAASARDGAGRVLLVHTEAHGWTLPGGPVGSDAQIIPALQRLVEEASGCRVAVGRLAGLYAEIMTGAVCLLYLCAHAGGDLRTEARNGAAGWFTPDDALGIVTDALHADRLRDALHPDAGGRAVHRLYRLDPYRVLREQELAVDVRPGRWQRLLQALRLRE